MQKVKCLDCGEIYYIGSNIRNRIYCPVSERAAAFITIIEKKDKELV